MKTFEEWWNETYKGKLILGQPQVLENAFKSRPR